MQFVLELLVHGIGNCGVFAVITTLSGETIELEYNEKLIIRLPGKTSYSSNDTHVLIQFTTVGKN